MSFSATAGGGGGTNELEDVGCFILTSNVDIYKSHFNSDVFIADTSGSVYDYKLDVFGDPTWTLNNEDMGNTKTKRTKIHKKSYQYTDKKHWKGNYEKVVLDTPYYMPEWNLDSYLQPAQDRLILYGVNSLSYNNFHDTVVVVLDPGETLDIRNCNLHGGLIVYASPTWDVRSGKRNTVRIWKSNIGTGAAPHIGLIAPACEIIPGQSSGGGGCGGGGSRNTINIHGFCFWNSVHDLDKAHVNGALIVVNEVEDLDHFNFHAHPPTLANPPEGVSLSASIGGTQLSLVSSGESIN